MFYSAVLILYKTAIQIAAIWNNKAKAFLEGRKNIFKPIDPNYIWMHCASLGEFEQGKPLLTRIKDKNPNQKILITFYSPSGYENAKTINIADEVRYLPIDFLNTITQWINHIKPKYLILVKYEFWPNLLRVLNKKKIPVYVVSGYFRKNKIQLFFISKLLKTIKHFWVQDKKSKQHLNDIGVNQVTISGNSRFDTAWDNFIKKTELPLIKDFKGNKKLLVMGSVWPKAMKLIPKNHNYKIIIAPHEMQHVKKFQKITHAILYSEANKLNITKSSCLIIDNIGMLSNIYQYADVVYIGGGFNSGIHNILEPAVFNCPTIFGPKHKKFPEALDLINLNGAKAIRTANEFEKAVNYFFNSNTKNNIQEYCKKNKGVSEKIILELQNY